jgi:hypothetical protein
LALWLSEDYEGVTLVANQSLGSAMFAEPSREFAPSPDQFHGAAFILYFHFITSFFLVKLEAFPEPVFLIGKVVFGQTGPVCFGSDLRNRISAGILLRAHISQILSF